MLRILYLAHDLSDPAIRRRVLALQTGNAEVTLAGFRRGESAGAAIGSLTTIELGTTEDARFIQRAGAVARACLSLGTALRGVVKPDIVIARNLEMLAVARRAVSLFGGDVPIVYECLDIHRLLLRQDNALRRLLPLAERLGLLTDDERRTATQRLREEERAMAVAHQVTVTPAQLRAAIPADGAELTEPDRVARVVRLRCIFDVVVAACDQRHIAAGDIPLRTVDEGGAGAGT